MAIYYYLSENTLEVTFRSETGFLITTGVGTITIVDRKGTEVEGITWPQTITNAGLGKYTYAVPVFREDEPEEPLLKKGKQYVAQITFTAPEDHYAECGLRVRPDQED